MQAIDNAQAKRLFLIFIGLHLLIWTLIPTLVRYNLPMDALEGTIWGKYAAWGYDKNPFLNGWLSLLAIHLSSQADWGLYLFSQLCVITCMWAVWKLGNEFLTQAQTCLAVFLLETLQYFNLHAIDFNDNTLELGLWALTIYFFYRALRSNSYLLWILTGVFAGLGMMAKYYTLALLAAMVVFVVCDKEQRKVVFNLKPYIGLLCFFLIITPHVLWLFNHDFITINYVFDRAGHQKLLYHHFLFPTIFLWQQLQVVLPALLMMLIFLVVGRMSWRTNNSVVIDSFDRRFLFTVAFGPLLLTALLSFCFSIKLRAGWGMPLLSFSTLFLIAFLRPQVTIKQLNQFFYASIVVMLTTACGYIYTQRFIPNTSSANFPGREIATKLSNVWQEQYHQPLQYVVGRRWLSSNISHYSPTQPKPLFDWQPKLAPWVDVNELKTKGGVFVWNVDKEKLPAYIKSTFPQLTNQQLYLFKWKGKRKEPIRIALMTLPPMPSPSQTHQHSPYHDDLPSSL